MKYLAPLLAYTAIAIGLFLFHSGWGALLGFHSVIIVSLLFARPNIPLSILSKSKHIQWRLASLLLCGSSGIALYFLWPHFGFADDLPEQITSIGLTARTWPMFIAYFSLVNPFLEEYFWRGYLGNDAKRFYIYDLVYAGYHALLMIGKVRIEAVIFALTMLTLAGWFWRQAAREDDGLLAPALGHMAADFTILLAIFWNTI